MRLLRTGVFFLVVLAFCGVLAAHADVLADTASFSSTLSVVLKFPVINMVGYASLNDAYLPKATCLTQGVAAITACMDPTSTFAANVLTFTAGTVAGNAGPGIGFASGVSFGISETIKITNNTGADINVPLSGTYNYNLVTKATGTGAAGAAVSFRIEERLTLDGNPMIVFGPKDFAIVSPPDSSSTCVNCPIGMFNIAVPNNSSVFINIDPFASGDAKVPEPSAFIPLLTIATAGWLRTKWPGRAK